MLDIKKYDIKKRNRKKMLLGVSLLALGLTGCGKSRTSWLEKGIAAVTEQDYRTAQEAFAQALVLGEDEEQTYRGMGLAYMGQQDYARALGSFTMALGEAGIKPTELEYDINYYMAICYYKLGEYDAAISCYDAITGLMPKETKAYFLRGNMKLCLHDLDGAVADFDQAVAIDKKDYGLCLDIYDSMISYGYGEKAQQYLDMVEAADVKTITDYDKGRLCYHKGEYEQACNYLERARSGAQASAELITLLGECYKKQGQYEYAAVVYSGYAEEHQDAEICNQLGLCYVEQGEYEQALLAFQRGKEIRENNTCMQTLKKNEIACYEYLHDYRTAAELLKDYMDTYGGDDLLRKEYAFLTTR
ncbi:MAG: tetratricopeptide repeat protein [Lachnospiraceae bacterium]|nr:tetratricopeptide repeat protein [Lachnospiraceae bacterium]